MIKEKASPVYIEQIAELLTVEQFYTVEQFAKITGIKSAKARLDKLTSQGAMIRTGDRYSHKWVMTDECKEKMLEIGEENRAKGCHVNTVPTTELIIAIQKLGKFTLNSLRTEIKNKTGILITAKNTGNRLRDIAKEDLTIKQTKIKHAGQRGSYVLYELIECKPPVIVVTDIVEKPKREHPNAWKKGMIGKPGTTVSRRAL